jgi:hypothetical protein
VRPRTSVRPPRRRPPTPATHADEVAADVVRRLHRAERQIGTLLVQLESIAVLLRSAGARSRNDEGPARGGAFDHGHTQTRTEDLSRVKRAL